MADKPAEKEFTPVYRFARLMSRVLFSTVMPTRLKGREKLKAMKAPYILIANHRHALDPVYLGGICPCEVRFLGKKELTGSAFTKWLMDRLHMISIARHESDLEALRKATKEIRAGHVLGIFPEGTRYQPSMMETVESGTAFLALREKVPMVPVYIHRKFSPFKSNRARVGDPIMPESYPAGGPSRENADALCGLIRDTFYDLRRQEEEDR